MKKLLSIAGILAFAATGAIAHTGHPHTKAPAHAKQALICPVTGTKIASASKAVGHMVYKGKTYYFCCPDCKPKFQKNPQHYINNAKHGKFDKM